jgi:hypothetical protein
LVSVTEVKDPASQTWHICQKVVAHRKNKHGSNKEKHEDTHHQLQNTTFFLSEIVLLPPPEQASDPNARSFLQTMKNNLSLKETTFVK